MVDSFATNIRVSSLFDTKNFWLLSWNDLMKLIRAPSRNVNLSPGIILLWVFIAYMMSTCRVKLYMSWLGSFLINFGL